ncbi:MAG: glycosyltransferase [Acidobacteriia bacterium]|nr:glycosyltransferase [Terriglobia bacterium]
MKVVHTVAGLWEHTGGPAESVPALCRGLAEAGHRVTLITGQGELVSAVHALEPAVTVRLVRLGPYRLANYSRESVGAVEQESRSAELIHTHGLWLHPNWVSARVARRRGLPLVVSPRGMLAEWALDRRRLFKRVLWHLVDGPACRGAAIVHCTSQGEATEVRRAGCRGPLAVIPNGVDTMSFSPAVKATGSPREVGHEVLFMSRIHPKKALDLLLEAWAGVRASQPAARLALAGPGEPHNVAWLREMLDGSLGRGVRYLGVVAGEERLRLLRSAAVVVLPSRSENYGMVVAEALACGTPVITTTGTPWHALPAERCGWVVEPEVAALAGALDAALRCSGDELAAMGARGRAFVVREHSLGAAVGRMVAAYEWVLGRGPKPAFVQTCSTQE